MLCATGSGQTVVSHWTFDQSLNDAAGSRNLTLTGSGPYSTNRPAAIIAFSTHSIDLSGGSNRATYDVTGVDALQGPYAISLWANHVNGTGIGGLFGTRSPSDQSLDIQFNSGNLIHGDIGTGSAWISTNADANFDYQGNTWHHIVYNVAADGDYQIYADGVQVANNVALNSVTPPLLFDQNHDIFIGDIGPNLLDFPGLIDEVWIFSGNLSQQQVTNLGTINALAAQAQVPEPISLSLWFAVGAVGVGAASYLRRRR